VEPGVGIARGGRPGVSPLTEGIKGSELVIFTDCAHAPIYENVAEFNARTMDFLTRNL
jgi:pimeloyl-ACP methyl ester carboxylesterase